MKFGLSTVTRGVFTTRENYVAIAKAAERAGFDFLSVSDHLIVPGEFKSLYDFCERIETRFLNKRVFESLIKSGAVDSFGGREQMLASVDDAINALQRAARSKESGQHGLFFGGGSSEPKVHFELCDAPSWSEEERLASEYAMLGFYVSGHPLEKYSSLLKDMNVLSLEQV